MFGYLLMNGQDWILVYQDLFVYLLLVFVCLSFCLMIMICQSLWVILCCLLEKGREGTEELRDERKEKNRGR